MLGRLRNSVRRRLRGVMRGGEYPVLLPHFRVVGEGLSTLGGEAEKLAVEEAAALSRCDGTRPLREIVRETGVAASRLIAHADEGRVVFWGEPVGAAVRRGLTGPGWAARVVVLSPHPDDAVLSACDELVFGAETPEDVALVINVFSQTAWSRFGEVLATVERVQAVRRAEEELAMRMAGSALWEMDLPEALLRGYGMEDVFGEIRSSDAGMVERVMERVAEVVGTVGPDVPWVLPLGVGGHVDHRIARDGALAGLARAGVGEDRITFYEDLPYAAALAVAGRPADFSGMIPGVRLMRLVPENHGLIDYKRWLMRVYWSQLTVSQIRQVERYSQRGECRWRKAL